MPAWSAMPALTAMSESESYRCHHTQRTASARRCTVSSRHEIGRGVSRTRTCRLPAYDTATISGVVVVVVQVAGVIVAVEASTPRGNWRVDPAQREFVARR